MEVVGAWEEERVGEVGGWRWAWTRERREVGVRVVG